jgi:hypothetical protein
MAGFRKPEVLREQLTLWSLLCTTVAALIKSVSGASCTRNMQLHWQMRRRGSSFSTTAAPLL